MTPSFYLPTKIIILTLSVLLILPFLILASATNLGALSNSSVFLYTETSSPEDLYDYGYCTYWAALRRLQINLPIPNDWGNAATWSSRARVAGYQVDHTPSVGSIMQDSNAANGLGHVAFVESVNENGTWEVSEMNYKGWDEVDTRLISADQSQRFNFIH